MRKKLHWLRTLIDSPLTQLITGMILLISGLATAYYEFTQANSSFRLGSHHGVALWGIVQILGSIPDLIDGIDRSFVAMEKHTNTKK